MIKKRVIETNRVLWFFILTNYILNLRPHKTAKNYKKIWLKNENVSPLKFYTELQKKKRKNFLKNNILVDYAMRYGSPGINEKIQDLKSKGCENI